MDLIFLIDSRLNFDIKVVHKKTMSKNIHNYIAEVYFSVL